MSDADLDYVGLGEAVRLRRVSLSLPVDLSKRSGPSEMTVRKIELGEARGLRQATKQRIERALEWPEGMIDRILSGKATAEERETRVERWVEAGDHQWLPVGSLHDKTGRTLTQALVVLSQMESTPDVDAARLYLGRVLEAQIEGAS